MRGQPIRPRTHPVGRSAPPPCAVASTACCAAEGRYSTNSPTKSEAPSAGAVRSAASTSHLRVGRRGIGDIGRATAGQQGRTAAPHRALSGVSARAKSPPRVPSERWRHQHGARSTAFSASSATLASCAGRRARRAARRRRRPCTRPAGGPEAAEAARPRWRRRLQAQGRASGAAAESATSGTLARPPPPLLGTRAHAARVRLLSGLEGTAPERVRYRAGGWGHRPQRARALLAPYT